MKKFTFLLLITLGFATNTILAQSPESFNYQAVIRDASNIILSNQNVGLQFRLLQGSPAGTSVYTETHSAITDSYGLVALAIGTGTTSDDFSTIDWANGPYFLEIAADITGGTSYNVLGTQQLMSVPYALYAKTSGSTAPSDAITDTDNDTKIQVEATTDEDIIRFSVAGTEQLTIDSNRIVIQDTLQYIDGNQATDKILLSDANGNATWSNIQSLGLFDGITVDGNTNDIDCLEITETAALPDMGNNKGILVEDNIFYSVGEIASLGIPDYSLVMFDISDANNSVFLGDVLLPTTGGSNGKTLIKVGNILYVAMNGYINAVDVSDPSNPILLDAFSHSAVSATNSNLRYFDSRLFFAETNGSDILQFDVSDPSNISTLPNFTLVNTGATLLSMDIADGKLYYTDQSTGFPMHIFDITATTEQFLGTSTVATFGNSYFLIDNGYAYIYDKLTDNKLKIINVSDPTNIQLVSELSIISNQSEVYITKYNNLLIVEPGTAGGATGIEIIDVSDPANPIGYGILYGTELGVISSFEEYVYVDNTKLYVYASDNDAILTFELNCLGATVGVAYNPNTGAFESIEDLDEQSLSLSGTNLSISNGNTVNLSSINTTQILITDADNDTKIQVEESGDEDMIRFDIAGIESMVIRDNGNNTMIEFPGTNTLGNTLIGTNAGLSLTTGKQNVFLGQGAGKDMAIGSANTFIGRTAGKSNRGGGNTFLGFFAGINNINGYQNIFIGYKAGELETGSNKLYIENSNSTTPLIYGEFNNDLLRINGTLQITGGYTDADNDTKIQVEESTDEDMIRFDIAGTQRMILDNNGFVGIGTSNPTANLTVMGAATTNTEITHFSNSNNAKKAIISLSNTGAGQIVLLDGTNNTDVLLSASDNSYFNTANLGVGNNNPQEKLHITGNIRMEDGNQGIGKVMTSDANGTATWQTVTSASNTISDADNDTKIQVEESADEDVIRFDVGGAEQLKLSSNELLLTNANLKIRNATSTVAGITLEGNHNSIDRKWEIETVGHATNPNYMELKVSYEGVEKVRFSVSGDIINSGDIIFGGTEKFYPPAYDIQTVMLSGQVTSGGAINNSATSSSYIASTVRNSEGIYTINFVSGTFSKPPIITFTPFSGSGNNRFIIIDTITSSSVSIQIRNDSGTLKDAPFNFIAIGER